MTTLAHHDTGHTAVPAAAASSEPAIAAIRKRCRARGLQGYVAFTPSNLLYTTGFRSYFVSEWWRLHGTVLAFVPADEARPVTLLVGDFEEKTARAAAPEVAMTTYRLWVDLSTEQQMAAPPEAPLDPRPEQWDPAELDARVAAALRDLGMDWGRIGTDLPFLTVDSLRRFERSAPDVTWVDLSADLYEIRLVKQDWEVERLRTAVALSEEGMTGAMRLLSQGMTAQDVRVAYQIGVAQAALGNDRFVGYTDNWVLPTIGRTTSASYGSTAGRLAAGDLVKFDCGTTVGGYRSDGGRTFAFGEPSREARHLYGILARGQELARERLVPGARVGDAFTAAMDHVRASGYPSFNRGHVGHSVGIDTFHEEPPFIGPDCDVLVQPGMVFAVEVPSYTPDVGAVMIEDMVVIREDGPELLHTLPHELVVVTPR